VSQYDLRDDFKPKSIDKARKALHVVQPISKKTRKPNKPKTKRPIDEELGYVEVECNSRLLEEVAEELNVPQGTVDYVIHTFTQHINKTIRAGNMDGVAIPYLGKIQVKHINRQFADFIHANPKEFKNIIKQITPESLHEIMSPDEIVYV
jgi:hypothetical protein